MKAVDHMGGLGQQFKMGSSMGYLDGFRGARGDVLIELRNPDGGLVDRRSLRNTVTKDAGLSLARLTRDRLEPRNSFNMLAVGSGALGNLNNPNPASADQRRLMNEIQRKPFAETTFRDQNGAASAIPTNVVDYTVIFGQGEAVGPLNEMGILLTISDNTTLKFPNPNFAGQGGEPYDPSIDVTKYDVLNNYLTFPVINKPVAMVMSITWRLTFGL